MKYKNAWFFPFQERVNYSFRFNWTQPGQWGKDCARLESAELISIPKQLPYAKALDDIVFEVYIYGPNMDYFRLNVVQSGENS